MWRDLYPERPRANLAGHIGLRGGLAGVPSGCGRIARLASTISTAPNPLSGRSIKKTSIVMSSSTCARLMNATTLRSVNCSIVVV